MIRRRKWIINRPDWQSRRQRVVLGGLTFLFWLAWTYLWLPVISFIAWMLGIHTFYVQIFKFDGYKTMLSILGAYGLVVFLMGGSLVGWAIYNWLRFRGIERRLSHVPIGVDDLAAAFSFPLNDLKDWQRCQSMVAHHDQNGRLTGVDCDCDRGREYARDLRASISPPA